MLTKSNDELVIKNGLPKWRRRTVKTIILPENTEKWSELLCCGVKLHPTTCHEGTGKGQMHSSTLSLTSVLNGCPSLTPPPGCFTAGKRTRFSLQRRLGKPRDWSGRLSQISPPPDFEPRTVEPVASCYSDYAIPAPLQQSGECSYLLCCQTVSSDWL